MRPVFNIIFFSTMLLLKLSVLNAQQRIYNLVSFSTASGLPSNEIRGLATDADGMLWISTNKGLAFYDGHQIHAIPFHEIAAGFANDLGKVAIDKRGLVWVATDNQGLLCYDRNKPLKRSIRQYFPKLSSNSLKNELYEVFASRSGLIYFGGQEMDLQVLNPETGKVKRIVFPNKNRKAGLSIYCIREDSLGILWIGSRYEGFFRYDPRRNRVNKFDLNQQDENAVSSFVFRKDDVYCMYYDNDLVKYNPNAKSLQVKLLEEGKSKEFYDNTYSCMTFDPKKDEITAGHVSKGIVIYQPKTGIRQYKSWKELCPKCELPIKANVLLTTAKGYWLGTTNGLFWYDDAMNKVDELIPSDQEAIIQVFRVGRDNWYRTENSFGRLSTDFKRKLSTYSLNGVRMSQINIIDRIIYFSSYYNGLFYFDTSQQLPVHPLPINGDKLNFDRADCNTVLRDSIDGKSILWIGTWNNGLYRYDMNQHTLACYDTRKGLPSNRIINLGKDGAGNIWLGMDGNGLLKILDKKRLVVKNIVQQHEEKIPSNKIVTFSRNNRDTMWFSTGSSGIGIVFRKDQKDFMQYFGDQNDFPHNYVNDIKDDGKGRLWLRSKDGFMIFQKKSKTFFQLRSGGGIIPPLPMKTLDVSFIDNRLILCTDKGIAIADLNNLDLFDAVVEKPIFSKLSIANKDNSYRLLEHKDQIKLNPEENNFTIHFSHPNTMLREFIFAYRLQGVDADWVQTKADLQAVYNNLRGGNYIFEVKIGDKHGNWSPNTAQLAIYLQSKWYQTLWFRTLVLMTGIGVVIGLFLYRLRQQQKINELQLVYTKKLQDELLVNEQEIKEQSKVLAIEKEKKLHADFRKKLVESELKAIRSQMNPHFIFNVFNSIEAYVIENDSKSASRLIHKFATLSRIVLENSQFALVGITSELHLIQLYLELEQDRFAYSFAFQINIDPDMDVQNKKIPSMLIQPVVENAVHHGIRNITDRHGLIHIHLKQEGEHIVIDVLDNGTGFVRGGDKNKGFKNTSFGLKGVQDRLDLINDRFRKPIASLTVISLPEKEFFRTQVTIILPSINDDEMDLDPLAR